MTTMTQKVTSFKTSKGHDVTVFNVKGVETKGFWTGCTRSVRTFAVVDGTHEVEVETGCVFKAASATKAAGFGGHAN